VSLALKYPDMVRGLVLASGYYYPTARPDVIAMGAPALPLVALGIFARDEDSEVAEGRRMSLDMLGVFAEFETNLRKERQMEGIAKARAAGVYKGRPPSVDCAKDAALKAEGWGPSQIARKLNISRASVYRALEG
jgi:DNA invertase Pin-like site-specific DNA recombinase